MTYALSAMACVPRATTVQQDLRPTSRLRTAALRVGTAAEEILRPAARVLAQQGRHLHYRKASISNWAMQVLLPDRKLQLYAGRLWW